MPFDRGIGFRILGSLPGRARLTIVKIAVSGKALGCNETLHVMIPNCRIDPS